jgi:hypothetical protein
MNVRYRSVLAAAIGLASLACHGSSQAPAAGTPARIEVASGSSQTGVVGQPLAGPVVVKVTDARGAPVAGQLVSFRATSGGGSAAAGAAVTNGDGVAQDRWVLGTAAGAQRMEARVVAPGVDAAALLARVDAVAVAGSAASVSVVAGGGQAGEPGSALVELIQVRVTDAYGNPAAGVAVTFAADAGGSADPATGLTDASGEAATRWTLGPSLGPQGLQADATGATPALLDATAKHTMAGASDAAVLSATRGVTPFISFVQLGGISLDHLSAIRFVIAPKAGSASKPVDATSTMDALRRRGYVTAGGVTLPVFGLYAGYTNDVTLYLEFQDASTQTVPLVITTEAYVDPQAIYDRPTIRKKRDAGVALGFDFFYMKSRLGTPVIVDTDGEPRWMAVGISSSNSTTFENGAFIIGDGASLELQRLELDGSTTSTSVLSPVFTNFHHNIDPGKLGLLADVDASVEGVRSIESILAEINPGGAVLEQWDFAALLADYMQSQGDDPSTFVRPGVDWLHMNGATYDPRDDSLIVSSRENFLFKVDYGTGALVWILGDPAKYWYTFPSLRAKAVVLEPGGRYPIGQHAPSITSDGLLMVFNDGAPSFNTPPGQPVGESRSYSAVSAYQIDPATLTAREAWSFDYDQTILSTICSSVYDAGDRSLLVDYAVASGMTKARLVGLDPAHEVVFDFEYPTTACDTSWNAQTIPLDALTIR